MVGDILSTSLTVATHPYYPESFAGPGTSSYHPRTRPHNPQRHYHNQPQYGGGAGGQYSSEPRGLENLEDLEENLDVGGSGVSAANSLSSLSSGGLTSGGLSSPGGINSNGVLASPISEMSSNRHMHLGYGHSSKPRARGHDELESMGIVMQDEDGDLDDDGHYHLPPVHHHRHHSRSGHLGHHHGDQPPPNKMSRGNGGNILISPGGMGSHGHSSHSHGHGSHCGLSGMGLGGGGGMGGNGSLGGGGGMGGGSNDGMPSPAPRPRGPKIKFTPEDDSLLVDLKENKSLTWKQIAEYFPGRSSGTLQVRYCTKLKAKTTVWSDETVSYFFLLTLR